MNLVPVSRSPAAPSIPRQAQEGLSLHEPRQQVWHLAALLLLLGVLTAPTYLAADVPYRGTLDLHAAMKVLGALVGLATGLTLVLRYFQLGRNRFYLFVGVAFLINGLADVAHGILCFRGFFPLGERDREMGEFLRTVYLRSQLLIGGALVAAILAPRAVGRRGWRGVVGWIVLLLVLPIPFILLWHDLGAVSTSHAYLGGAVFVVVLAGGLLCLDRYVFRREMFAWWLGASLFVNALGVLLVVLSREPLDPLFDLAHVYKAIGYFLPLVGCLLHQVARERAYFIAQDALIAAREAAMAGAKAKSEFLANMSHELRTPMNGVLGLVGRALRRGAGDPADLKAAYQSAQGLLQLLDDVLDLSKIDAGALTLLDEPFRPKALVESAIQPLSPMIQQKGLFLRTEIDPTMPEVLVGDAPRLRQVLINLVGNAVKFTDRGGVAIRVGFEALNEQRGRIRFDVQDTGVGIPADKQALAFGAFQQVDGSLSRRYGGAGLGLAICVQLVRLLDGSISLESEEGKGSAFSFDAVVRRATPQEQAELTPAALSDHAVRCTSIPKVLAVAEDNPINRRVLVGMLEEMGHVVLTAENGRDLLALLDSPVRGFIDAVLLDLQMPELSGHDVAKAIRREESASERRRLTIFAVTAHAMKGDRERCLEAGMDDHLVKPIEADRLFEALEAVAPRSPAVDRSGFWRQIAGRKELGRELLALLDAELPSHWSALENAVEGCDVEKLTDVSHRLAGSLANLHATSARDAARRLESAARAGDWNAVKRIRPILRILLDRSLDELREFLAAEIGAA